MKKIRKLSSTRKSGYALLVTVVLVSALVVAISIGMASRARNTLWAGFTMVSGKQTQTLSHSCAQFALYQFAETLHYSGNEGIIIGNGTCSVLATTDLGGDLKGLRVEMTVNDYTERVAMKVVESDGSLSLVEWSHVAEH